ncbi:hypothetical protein IQ07DRAFT_640587 [Pyrenochaeta sp. DS3sAY3a]|nr:hypothetical protein IQ07DRAFT_640587 [Pyrenochaeta sp. DS3sAY3a]
MAAIRGGHGGGICEGPPDRDPASQCCKCSHHTRCTHKMAVETRHWFIAKDGSDDNDAESFRDSTDETVPRTDSIQAALSLPGVREEILEIVVKDDSLQQSGTNAVEVLSAEIFVASFTKLLQTLAKELRQEAEHNEQRFAALVFWNYASYAASSAWEYWSCGGESAWSEMRAQLSERTMGAASALQRVAWRTGPEDVFNDDDGTNIDCEDYESELQHPVHLKPLKHFVTNSIAFQDLRRNLENLSGQSNHEEGQMRSNCRFAFTRSPVTAIQDFCKKSVEHVVGTRLSWWPLSEPEETLKVNYTRVYCQPPVNSSRRNPSFFDDIPSSLADKLFHGLAAARSMTSESRWETLRHEAVFLEGTTLMRLLRNRKRPSPMNVHQAKETELATKGTSGANEQASSSRSTVEVDRLSAGIDGRGTEMKDLGAGLASDVSMDNGTPDPNDDENVRLLMSEEAENKPEDTKSVLFLSLDIDTNDSRACSVDVGMNDQETMTNLRDSYKDLRGSFFRIRKSPVGIKFYRFKSFLYKSERRHYIQLHRDKERYPPKEDANYDWDLGNEWQDGDPYPNGEAWYFFKHPKYCGSSTALRDMLPKRRKDELRSGITVYGLYIEQRHSVWQIFIPVVLVLTCTLGGTLWFIRPWLRDHPGDLQGATVPVFLALTVVQSLLGLLTTLVVFRWSL